MICSCFFFFNDTATTEIYTLSLHDALPILPATTDRLWRRIPRHAPARSALRQDRKSTRLNSSHSSISYAVFWLKKKKTELHQLLLISSLSPHPLQTNCQCPR